MMGRAEIKLLNSEKPVSYRADRASWFPTLSWVVECGGMKFEIKHTNSGMDKYSSKHLKMVNASGELVCRWESMYSQSTKSLGKLQIWGEETAQIVETGQGEGQRWAEWCLSVMVTIAEIEKTMAQVPGAL